ncbi:hypothetical protein GLOIN_2v1773489 [Rhizophagus irregularis DAOM 181602=DAOM 197198]|uniref:Uncharacterized protein n=1 Tax=Rhizophagus irregularis (strain DAOM 181602 / DAOM 197198 / MUCL 43194) TaxID=747089 RepID=A0A2P4Q4V6_RHIID|nr:hypothetical protein GLOIN_2v1773489 [Rhizophagus irregularis DAOM 181602=DAOM 197198]POG72666.1 hypothetical protein GLOIN_2v1773489 [Rhizophagus irregularis DAOM 181602=DAOM 197198]|eukprot:XP_025179532.1 hypothetical protein GLOIN_2v1773489 [Rhizophagus irregularis DAOM 181602=DAOM 197198]
MADARRLPVLTMIAPVLAKTKPYIGQEPPDDYLDRLIQSISFAQGHMTVLENANAGDFDDVVKCDIFKAQMGGKYLPVPAQDPYNGNANINSPATLRAWMRSHYQRETVGVADNDAPTIGFLKNHLSGDLYTWMRAVAPAGINAFFTNLKDMWLERAPNLNGNQNYQNNSSAEIEKLNSQIVSLQAQLAQPAQLAESMQVHSKLAQRLQLPENVVNSNNASIFDNYINQELEKRLGVIEINLANPIKRQTHQTRLEKRLERIETHLAKFARKDTRDTKTPQRQRSESSPFGGLEKRLGQIEALLAKLAKDSKSRSSRVHMATVDEQSNPIFSDDDTLKPEDNDYNSDNSSAVNYAEQREYPDKSSKSKVSNKYELRKVKQDNNVSSTHNASSDKDSHGKRVSLEETIRKIIQIEFENYLPYIIQQAKKCAPALAQDSDKEDVLDGPMEIDFVKKKEPTTSIASIKCKIKRLKIPAMALDSCAELPIITPDIVERVGYGIDKSIKHDLSGIATVPVESIGVVHNLPITLAPGFTIYEDFIVVKYSKPMLIFLNPLLKKYKCAIDWDKDELKISHNGKDLIIPVTMHKVKNKLEVNCVTTTPECDKSSIPDQVDLNANETLKKK